MGERKPIIGIMIVKIPPAKARSAIAPPLPCPKIEDSFVVLLKKAGVKNLSTIMPLLAIGSVAVPVLKQKGQLIAAP